ncbi:hypothetical protein J4228_00720 [Candidatus Woesearchaeota archaeon]|nr:hypothetical protein [Candidatus Woesearchaeota archaeon]
MKKVVVSIFIVMVFVFLVGCLNYKAYDLPKDNVSDEEASLVDEIARVETELGLDQNSTELQPEDELVVEEVVLPELDDINETDLTDVINKDEITHTITVKENELLSLKVNVEDPDNDSVMYTFTKPLNKSGEWKTNYGDVGEYTITLTATDGKLSSSQKIKLVVDRVNVPPVIAALKDLIVNEGEVVVVEPKVIDPNNDAVSLTISEPLKSGKFATDHTSAGEYKIIVMATDGELESKETFSLRVNNVNMLPKISGVQDVTVKEGETVTLKPVVTDLDEDQIKLSITEPVGNSGVWKTSFTDHGEYMITITADDGKDKVTKKVRVQVLDVNMPPQIVDVSIKTK